MRAGDVGQSLYIFFLHVDACHGVENLLLIM